MAGRTLPNLKLVNKWPPGSSGWGPDMDNNLNLLDALLFLTVLSATTAAPPGSPAQGDRYIVPVGGTGAWVGSDNKVAVYIDTAWVFIAPSNGWTARVLDVPHMIHYTGSAWTADGGAVTSVSGRSGDVTLAQLISDGLEATSHKGAASGYAPLDAGSKVPIANLPSSVVGALEYQGTWNASTNVPPLASGSGTKGFYYKVSTAGATTIDGNSQWNPGDMIAYDGTTWDKIDGIMSEVISVVGLTGLITLTQLIAAGLAPISNPAFTGSAAVYGPATITGPLKVAYNLGGTDTSSPSAGQTTIGWNATSGGGEVDYFNDYWIAAASYIWWQRTDTNLLVQLMRLNPDGSLHLGPNEIEVATKAFAATSPAAFSVVGKPAASQVINIVIGVASVLPANFAGAVAFFSAVPTADATFTVKQITVAGVVTTIGTAQLAAGSSRALTLSTQAAVSFAAGDVLQLVGPATQDATLADGGITFVLTKT